jgi:hypothetical protein
VGVDLECPSFSAPVRQADHAFGISVELHLAAVEFAVYPWLLAQTDRVVVVGILVEHDDPARRAPGDAPIETERVFVARDALVRGDQRDTPIHPQLEAAVHVIHACVPGDQAPGQAIGAIGNRIVIVFEVILEEQGLRRELRVLRVNTPPGIGERASMR